MRTERQVVIDPMDPKIAPLGLLPQGLARALIDDPAARRQFAQLSPVRQNRLISAARRARSPQEVRSLLEAMG